MMHDVKNKLKNIPFSRNLLLVISAIGLNFIGHSQYMHVNVLLWMCLTGLIALSFIKPDILPRGEFRTLDKQAIIGAVVLEGVLLLRFCSGYSYSLMENLLIQAQEASKLGRMIDGVILCVLGFYAVYTLCSCVLKAMHPLNKFFTMYRKPMIILSVVFCASLIAIIRANYAYVDDMGRINEGYQLTGAFSRYIATFISTLLHGNTWLTDISPIPQLLAAVIMAVAAVVLHMVITEYKPMKTGSIIAVIPFGVFPFFLECYSYKYDAPYMALSVLVAIFPLLFKDYHPIKYGIAVCVSMVAMCMLYQSSSGIFPVVVAALCFFQWINGRKMKKIVTFLATSVIGYGAGLLLFRYCLMESVKSDYTNTSVSLKQLIPNMVAYITTLYKGVGSAWVALIALIVIVFLIIVIKYSKRSKIATFFVAITTIVVMVFLSGGVYLIFEQPVLSPRAVYGFMVVLAIVTIPIGLADKHFVGKTIVAFLGFLFFIFSFTYGNALHQQNEYAHFRLEQVIEDIDELGITQKEGTVTIQISGSIGHAPQLEGWIEKYPLLADLVNVQVLCPTYWGYYELVHYYGLEQMLETGYGMDVDFAELDLPVVKESVYHTIRASDEYMLIEIK